MFTQPGIILSITYFFPAIQTPVSSNSPGPCLEIQLGPSLQFSCALGQGLLEPQCSVFLPIF